MLTEESRTNDMSAVSSMLEAIEQGDMDKLRRCFAPDALVWHNNDQFEQNIDTVITTMLEPVCAISTSRTYEDRRVTSAGSSAFLQHTLTIALNSGREVRIPTMMRVYVNSDGLVGRIEEYFDSRAVEPIFEGLS